MAKKKVEAAIEIGVWVICSFCGTEYLENKACVLELHVTECPVCGAKLGIKGKGELL